MCHFAAILVIIIITLLAVPKCASVNYIGNLTSSVVVEAFDLEKNDRIAYLISSEMSFFTTYHLIGEIILCLKLYIIYSHVIKMTNRFCHWNCMVYMVTAANDLSYRTRIKFRGVHLIHENSTGNSLHTRNLIHLHCQTTKILPMKFNTRTIICY